MKKIISLFMLAILILSVVPVFAEERTRISAISTEDVEAPTATEPTAIRTVAEPISAEETELAACVRRKMAEGLSRLEARKRCTLQAAVTIASTTSKFEECIERYVNAGVTKERARIKCGGQAVVQITERVKTCIEAKMEEGLTQEEAKKACAQQGLERAREVIETKIDVCVNKMQEKYPDVSDEDAKLKCGGLLRARVTKVTNFAKLNEREIKKVALLERARVRKLEGLNEAKIKAQLRKYAVKTIKKSDLFSKRVIAANKLREAENKYQAAKERYEQIKAVQEERKENFLEAKEQLKACEGVESEECDELGENIVERAKEYLINSAELAIEHLKKIRERVESTDDIGEEEAAKIIEDIDNAIEALEKAIEDVKAAETKEEIKEAAQTINRIWAKMKNRAKLHAARVVHAKVGEIVVRSRQLEAKLGRVLERMEEAGIEVGGIESKVDDFSAKVEEARDLYKQSREKFTEAKETSNPELVKEARELAKEAHQALKEAHRILVDIIKAIREAGGSLEVEEEEEIEVVEEVEEEEEEEELADSTTVEEYEEEEIEEPEEEEEEIEEENIEETEEGRY